MGRQVRTDLDSVFTALADPTRRAILARLAQGDTYVTELTKPHNMSFAAVSKHIQVLENAGLASRIREGRKIRCRFNPAPLDQAEGWITQQKHFWEGTLDSFGEFLSTDAES
ncbi:MAG: metalloregulator ArsR/SmtB family transcription factor [Sneathiellales bacterium]|nr:metalloregulator ArsR/SmtB family transcription factor [Sneathiellales bacterium]